MAKDYYSGHIPDFWTSYRQRKATGGRSLTSGEMRGLTSGLLSHESELAMDAGRRHEQKRQFDEQMAMKKEAMEREKEAAQAQGLVNIGGLYGQYKVGMASADALKAAALKEGVGGAATASGAGATVAGAASEGLVTTGAGELTGSLVPGLGQEAALETTTSFTPSVLAEAGAGEAAASTMSTGAAVSAAAAPAMLAGGVASYLLRDQSELVQAGGAALAGGIAGYMMIGASVGGPAGFIIGAAIGAVTSLFDDVSVVCTELKRQGLLDTRTHRGATMYAMTVADPIFYHMYRQHGDWIVPKMRKSKLITYLIAPFGRGLARECAHRYDPVRFPKGSIIGTLYERWLIRKLEKELARCHSVN